ncbi:MAG: YbfB/YjiJ family MFS transporter [Spirochaetales bacterium]|nr:YbfB/YjiJ family MFS transporter [Spirochaetales bacterium]
MDSNNVQYNQYESSRYAWIILIISLCTVIGALGFARFGYTMILPGMKTGLGLSEVQAGDLATGNMVGYLVLALTCGVLASRFGPRFVIGGSMVLISLAMFLTGFAPDFITALIARILTGMGSGGANVPVMGLIAAWFVSRKRGLAAGIAVSGSSFGLFITGLSIPVILKTFPGSGWRYSWFFLSGITLIFGLFCLFFLRNKPEDKGLPPVETEKRVEEASPGTISKTGKVSILQWDLVYKNLSVWHLAFVYILFGFSYIIYTTFFVRYLTMEAGFTTESAGKLWAFIGGGSIASGFIWGSVSDKVGRKYGLAIVYFLQFLCFSIFGLWKTIPGFIISSILFAITAWSIPAIMAAASGDSVGSRLAPAALGFITLFFGIGQAAGPFVAGRIAQGTGSYSLAFVVAGAAAFLGAMTSLFIKQKIKG